MAGEFGLSEVFTSEGVTPELCCPCWMKGGGVVVGDQRLHFRLCLSMSVFQSDRRQHLVTSAVREKVPTLRFLDKEKPPAVAGPQDTCMPKT